MPHRIQMVRVLRPVFLNPESRKNLTELAQDGSAALRLAWGANALVLLDHGISFAAVANALLVDDDTVCAWHWMCVEDRIDGLASLGHEGSAYRLREKQQDKLKAWITETLPRMTRNVDAWIEQERAIEYRGQFVLIALLHRLGLEHHKPKAVSRKLDRGKQAAFIVQYQYLPNHTGDDEAVMLADVVHPMHAVRRIACWGPKGIQSRWGRPAVASA